jgi:acyl-CoA thioesterase
VSASAALPGVAEINRHIRKSTFNVWLGIEAIEASTTEVKLRVPWRPELGGAPGMTHGGIFACIADVAIFAAIYAACGKSGPTIDMRVDFHANAAGGELLAVARTVKAGQRILTGEVSIYDDRQRLLATGRAVFITKPGHMDIGG